MIGYLGSLAVLLVAAFWTVDALSGEIEPTFTLDNFQTLFHEPVYRTIALRTIAIAALVTITDILLAFPIAFYMAKVAQQPGEGACWWSRSCCRCGPATWSRSMPGERSSRAAASSTGCSTRSGINGPGYGNVAVWLVMSYLWLPFMIIPIYAGLERIPDSLLSASEDLGASPWTTFRRVILPLAFPAIIAGSIFTFSLTLGDYITPSLVSEQPVHRQRRLRNITNNLPLASAFVMVPIVVMIIYLLIARRLGSVRAPMRLSRTIHELRSRRAARRDRGHAGVHLHPADRDR